MRRTVKKPYGKPSIPRATIKEAVRAVWARALEKEPLERAIEREHYITVAATFRNEKDSRFLVPLWLRYDESFWEEVKGRKKEEKP